MKKRIMIIAAVILAAVVFTGFAAVRIIEGNLDRLAETEITDVDLSQTPDGMYYGSYAVFPVEVEVAVTVKNHAITGIDLIKHRNGRGAAAESIPDSVVKAGTLEVDVVSGATYSSKVILKAIENALTAPAK